MLLGSAEAQITFHKTHGSPVGNDIANSITTTLDGNYVFTGFTTYQNPVGVICVVKINPQGDTIWTKTIGDTIRFRNALFVDRTSDSGCIVAGYNTTTNGLDDIYLIKMDISGNIMWTKKYGEASADIIGTIHQTYDGGYIAAGHSYRTGNDVCLLMKLNSNGDTTWTRTYQGLYSSFFSDVKQTIDSGYIAAGYTNTVNNSDVVLAKTNATGNLLWLKVIGLGMFERVYSVENTADGGFIVGGETDSLIFLLKTDSIGNPIWCKTYSSPNYSNRPSRIIKTSDQGFALTGDLYRSTDTTSLMFLIKTNSLGDTLFTNAFSYQHTNRGNSILQTTDNGFLIAGFTNFYFANPIWSDIYIVKTDSLGSIGCYEQKPNIVIGTHSFQLGNNNLTISSGIQQSSLGASINSGGDIITICSAVGINEVIAQETSTLFPNPFTTTATLKFSRAVHAATLRIYNMFGQLITETSNINGESFHINAEHFRSGVYVYEVTEKEKKICSGKAVVY